MPSKIQQAPILSVEDLTVGFEGSRGVVSILEGIDFTLYPGEVLALVGETGCGKSVTAKSLLDLIPQLSRRRTGRIFFNGTDLLKLSSRELGEVRGRSIAMIFQNPQSSINPVFTLGEQMLPADPHVPEGRNRPQMPTAKPEGKSGSSAYRPGKAG